VSTIDRYNVRLEKMLQKAQAEAAAEEAKEVRDEACSISDAIGMQTVLYKCSIDSLEDVGKFLGG